MTNDNPLLQSCLPPPRAVTGSRIRRAAALWLLALAMLLGLVRWDVSVMAWISRLGVPGNHALVTLFRELAEYRVIAALCAAILLLDRRRFIVVAHVLFAVLMGFSFMCLGKLMIHRIRPAWLEGDFEHLSWDAGWHGFDLSIRRAADTSMPSGHSYTAFAMAFALAWFYPRWRYPVLVLAFGTAVSRVIERLHWPSDCWAGAMIGYFAAWISLHTRSLCTPARWFRGSKAADVVA